MMFLLKELRKFTASDHGAVTVDWTIVGAAVVGLGLASVGAVRTGTGALGDDIEHSLTAASVAAMGELGTTGEASVRDYHFLPEDTDWWNDQWEAYAGSTDDQLLSSLTWTANMANYALESNDAGHAAHRINYLRIIMNEAAERGLGYPDGTRDLGSLWDEYQTRFPPAPT